MTNLIVKWRQQTPVGKTTWFLRGLRRDGTFYGEVLEDSTMRRLQVDVQGVISNCDTVTLFSLAREILKSQSETTGIWSGLLANGEVQRPEQVYEYCQGAEASSEAARQFLSSIEIMRPYVEAAYAGALP
jgi:hypothetical protein